MKKALIVTLSLFVFSGCGAGKNQPQVELIQDMMQQPSVKAQDYDHYGDDGSGGMAMKLPPEGTVPQGHTPYTIQTSEEAERKLVNPLVVTQDILSRGQDQYYTYCYVCHGALGEGNGPVAEKMLAKPPSLVSTRIRGWKDGGIFHLITKGRGLMGSLASQIPEEDDRWAIVLFIRHLQDKNSSEN